MFRFSVSSQVLRRLLIAGGLVLSAALATTAHAAVPPGNGNSTVYDVMQHSSCCYTGDPFAATESLWHAFFEAPGIETAAVVVTTDLTQLNNFDFLYIRQSNIDALSLADWNTITAWVNAGGTLAINDHEGAIGASAFGSFLGASYTFTSTSAPSGDNIVVTNAANRLLTTPNVLTAPDLSNWGSSVHGAFSFVGSAYLCAANSTNGSTSLPVLCYARYGSGAIILTGFDPECGSGCHDNHLTGGTSSGSELWENMIVLAFPSPPTPPMPVPTSPTLIPGGGACAPLGFVQVTNDALTARPLGEFISGNMFALVFALGPVAGFVDFYVVVQLPNGQQLILNNQKQFLPFPATIVPFIANTLGPVAMTDLFNNLFTAPLNTIPAGTYIAHVVAVPAGTSASSLNSAGTPRYDWCFTKTF